MQENFDITEQTYSNYYIQNHSQFYNLARLRQQSEVLDNMQKKFEKYTSVTHGNFQQVNSNSNINFSNDINNSENNINNSANSAKINETNLNDESQNSSNSNPLSGLLSNLNLGNLAKMLSGGNFSNVFLNLLSGQNKELGNFMKLLNNPMIKKSFSKNKSTKSHKKDIEIEEQESNVASEIDKYEIIDNN